MQFKISEKAEKTSEAVDLMDFKQRIFLKFGKEAIADHQTCSGNFPEGEFECR